MLKQVVSIQKRISVLKENYEKKLVGLNLQLQQIRNRCSHTFKVVKPPVLAKSLVDGARIGHDETGQKKCQPDFTITCENCNQSRYHNVFNCCPRCFKKVKWATFDLRERHFGEGYSYYGAAIYKCTKCPFEVIRDEWNR
ncbi:hypothetical protein A2926_00065 [Candidatus Giovannonibacteria bacterium RIFCSPLOWO2_01_FULL_44_40]|uniref:Uncharacterized protein n=1 Tax=Candidatus Giovannonibacteria bacterium RIFCSPHIGHO2_01_FULL_45_23 TaxID=1798325 RepID=A0A1F5VH01_9BACT|nr:MAG: hypothetical protein A2834_01020 [Candidatus Giovannonibacteria bacterium RIFCSPHIGHO2_01_FULL_45_23]OGF75307.1 MAG: hypothetical protein A3C77_01230 [Candidatus Giovannonibacteria bacterium RIFCSPHIGHO2_02_FULL_45_13]OGF80377.1 MAG: hypothetical protein A2926_00065 [Candidatus Giovannonibacteria bacterium RIFCSPLOWO2_01_FULL_44_40]